MAKPSSGIGRHQLSTTSCRLGEGILGMSKKLLQTVRRRGQAAKDRPSLEHGRSVCFRPETDPHAIPRLSRRPQFPATPRSGDHKVPGERRWNSGETH